jgi:hypothetical protein
MGKKYEVPTTGDLDKIRETKESLLGLMPGGSLVNQLIDTFFVSPIDKRRDEWMLSVAEGLHKLEAEFGVLHETLRRDEKFLDILYTATAAAIKTSSEAKRRYLRNFLLNSALKPNEDECYRKSLLSKLERLEEAHVLLMAHVEKSRTPLRIDGTLPSKDKRLNNIITDLKYMGIDILGSTVGSEDGLGEVGRDLLELISELDIET